MRPSLNLILTVSVFLFSIYVTFCVPHRDLDQRDMRHLRTSLLAERDLDASEPSTRVQDASAIFVRMQQRLKNIETQQQQQSKRGTVRRGARL